MVVIRVSKEEKPACDGQKAQKFQFQTGNNFGEPVLWVAADKGVVTLASHMGTSSHSSCSTSDPAPGSRPGKRERFSYQVPPTHMGGLKEAPGLDPVLTSMNIWGMN